MIVTPYLIGLRPVYSISFQLWSRHENLQADMYGFKMSMRVVFLCHQVYAAGKKSRSNFMKCRTRASIFEKTGSLSNGVDDLENFTSEMEWSFLFPSVSPVFFQIGTVTYQHHLRFLKLSRFLNPKQLRFRLLILRFIPSTGPLEKSYSTLLRTAVRCGSGR